MSRRRGGYAVRGDIPLYADRALRFPAVPACRRPVPCRPRGLRTAGLSGGAPAPSPFSAKAAQTGRQPARRTTEILGRLCKFGVFILKFPLNSCTIGVVIPKGVCSVSGETAIFSIHDKKDYEIHEIVQQVYDALKEKGYNPVNQLVGYILSEDPTYITTYKNARSMIRKVGFILLVYCWLGRRAGSFSEDRPLGWDPVAEARSYCWGRGQQDASGSAADAGSRNPFSCLRRKLPAHCPLALKPLAG